jgi:hypothetical protein
MSQERHSRPITEDAIGHHAPVYHAIRNFFCRVNTKLAADLFVTPQKLSG